jgi:putative DNA primase/helicase
LGNAERFEDYYKEKVRHIPETKRWVTWDDNGWHFAKIFKLTKPVVRNIYQEASKSLRDEQRIELGQWAKKSENKSAQRCMLDLAASFMAARLDDFDADPKLLNCINGVVNLETRELLPHSPQQLHLKQAKAKYDPKAQCPRWLQFLREIFEGDQELIDYIQTAIGYSATALTKEHCFFLCYGVGRNGKTTFLETVREVLGGYAYSTDFDTFLYKDQSTSRVLEAIGQLKGRRFIIASETSDNTRLNEARIKKVTGGDLLTGTRLHQSSFEFSPSHTIWLACNHRPAIKDASVAMWDRVKAIPFEVQFRNEQQDKNLRQDLLEERDGILNWIVDGTNKYLSSGLPKAPQACLRATEEYREANDKLSIFIEECLVKEPKGAVGVQDVYKAYEKWCPGANEYPVALKFFRENMEERGIRSKRQSIGQRFIGYRLKTEPVLPQPTW